MKINKLRSNCDGLWNEAERTQTVEVKECAILWLDGLYRNS